MLWASPTATFDTPPTEEQVEEYIGQVGADNHMWEGKRRNTPYMFLEVIEHPSYADLLFSYQKETGIVLEPGLKLLGYATYPPATRNGWFRCRIHIVDPDVDYRPEIYGHELMHCVHGDFHPNHRQRLKTLLEKKKNKAE